MVPGNWEAPMIDTHRLPDLMQCTVRKTVENDEIAKTLARGNLEINELAF